MLNTFRDLHKALRSLRRSRGKRQYEVADAVGVSRSMVSAYENGRTLPTIETLDRILDALDAGLPELCEALAQYESPSAPLESLPADSPHVDVYQVFGIDHPLPVAQEETLRRIAAGFHSLLRVMFREVDGVTPAPGDDP